MKPALINDALEKIGTTPLRQGCKLIEILNRPQVTIENISEHIPAFQRELEKATSSDQGHRDFKTRRAQEESGMAEKKKLSKLLKS